jgi:hypothetical protein
MAEHLHPAPAGGRAGGEKRMTALVWAGIALLVIAITQVVIYRDVGTINGGLLILGLLIVGNQAWRLRRRS